jgi:hypothetical protein
MARKLDPLAALASGPARFCEEQVVLVAWLEQFAGVACAVLGEMDFWKRLWLCEELVVLRARLERAGEVVSLVQGV